VDLVVALVSDPNSWIAVEVLVSTKEQEIQEK
jgi:hypothetical protein